MARITWILAPARTTWPPAPFTRALASPTAKADPTGRSTTSTKENYKDRLQGCDQHRSNTSTGIGEDQLEKPKIGSSALPPGLTRHVLIRAWSRRGQPSHGGVSDAHHRAHHRSMKAATIESRRSCDGA